MNLREKLTAFILTLQDAFIAVVPFFLFTSILNLAYSLINYLGIEISPLFRLKLEGIIKAFQAFTSIAAVISISYFLAQRFRISQIMAVSLAVLVFITHAVLEAPGQAIVLPYGFAPETLFLPIISTILLKLLYPRISLKIPVWGSHYRVYRLFEYLPSLFVAYGGALSLFYLLAWPVERILNWLKPLGQELPGIVLLSVRALLVDAFWFIGLHGERMVNSIFGKGILFQKLLPDLTYGEFNRLFVSIGGAGAGFGLLLALLFLVRRGYLETITKISVPFVEFNINTLIIYAVVVLNRFLLPPFLVVPLINIGLSYLFLEVYRPVFTDFYVVWSTPVFIDAYLKSGGDLTVVGFQISLIVIDAMIYGYFLSLYLKSADALSAAQLLEKNLSVSQELVSEEGIKAFQAQKELIEAQARLQRVVESLKEENLTLYYQPVVDARTGKIKKLEALIRYREGDRIVGPQFLEVIEKAGLTPIIDVWVSRKVKEQLKEWRLYGIEPELSVNLHPDTLKSWDALSRILENLRGWKVTFEVVEKSFLYPQARENLEKLRKEGFKVALDDFGVGYSSLEVLVNFPFELLKIDKSLVDRVTDERGYRVCASITSLCHSLGIEVVAEGVEREEELNALRKIGVDMIQGFYFYRPMPAERVTRLIREV